MRKIIHGLLIIAALCLVYYIMSGIYIFFATIVFILSEGFERFQDTEYFGSFLINQAIYSILFSQVVTLLVIYRMYRKRGFNVMMRFKKISFKQTLISILLGLVMLGMSTWVVELLYRLSPSIVDNYIESISGITVSANFFVMFIIFAIMAPIFEEVLMRGVLFRTFEPTALSMGLIIILSGVMFGVFHMNIVQGLFAAIGGILIAYAFYASGSIWVPIIIHGVNNLVSVTFELDFIASLLTGYEDIYAYTLLLIVILGLPTGLTLLNKTSKKLIRNDKYGRTELDLIQEGLIEVDDEQFDDFFQTS
ncbi:lysostaphin resistance A-like protein [Liberiplasma polymorphum]|uniref:CPBP family intramembrane glutamic endopeptidase n=1 Tax=Liberiplasma polymorphum TaxID=3374570 RepID=UPI003775B631